MFDCFKLLFIDCEYFYALTIRENAVLQKKFNKIPQIQRLGNFSFSFHYIIYFLFYYIIIFSYHILTHTYHTHIYILEVLFATYGHAREPGKAFEVTTKLQELSREFLSRDRLVIHK